MFNKRKAPERPPLEPSPVRKEPDEPTAQSQEARQSATNSTSIPTSTPTMRNTAMIGASIKIQGEISGEENLQIDGNVEGKVSLVNHDLTVGQTGMVTANLSAKTVRIHGQVTGDIQGTEMVVVSSSGKVLGNIVSPRVTLEDGAQFKGSIDMSPDTENLNGAVKSTPAKSVSNEATEEASQATSAA